MDDPNTSRRDVFAMLPVTAGVMRTTGVTTTGEHLIPVIQYFIPGIR
jgi:hypothetical protein